jgi:eukaryotic-like serine/threonine-protein kinase
MTEPRPGDVVDERFSVVGLIGRGGMASVFKSVDLESGRAVALKFPFLALESDPVFYSRFQREIELGRTLDHPGILKMLVVERPSRPYAAMEYLEGETLWDRLQRTRPLPIDEALCLARLTCDALEYLREHGVVHRDLKPTNIMLCRDGSIRVMDFGLASAGAGRRLTFMASAGMGTVDYMAPEQLKGRAGDHRMDVYSLGAILYEMTTGRVPYDDQPDPYSMMKARLVGDPVAPRTYNPALLPQVEEIILRALAREPADRYQTASELKRDLMAPCDVLVTGRANRLQRPNIRSRYWKLAGVIAVGVLAPIVLFLLLLAVLKG